MSSDALFSREEVTAGLSGKRAAALLYMIESRTAQRLEESRQAAGRCMIEGAYSREQIFLESFAIGKKKSRHVSIRDIERYTWDWSCLLSDQANIRAAIAHLIGQKYTFTYRAVPEIREALHLQDELTKHAYSRQFHQPIESIYSAKTSLPDELRWIWNRIATRLENFPPFWMAFALTLTETVGASILALPIALAEIGPIGGIVFLIIMGVVNVLTVMYVAEALARNGNIRFGRAYFGQLISDFLGPGGSLVFTIALFLLNFLAQITYYIGFSTTLANATHIPAWFWTLLLFGIVLFIIKKNALNATISSAMVIGAVNIILILILSGLAFLHTQGGNYLLPELPALNGMSFKPAILSLVFGTILAAYFGHTSIASGARIVLRRDESGRSLILGSAVAQVAVIVLYSIWVLAISGAVPASRLARETGTALIPLSAMVGPAVNIFGSLFVILSMGLSSIYFSMGLYNLVWERLPSRRKTIQVLPRRTASLIFQRAGNLEGSPEIKLSYTGLSQNKARVRIDVQNRGKSKSVEVIIEKRADIIEQVNQLLPGVFRNGYLTIELLQSSVDNIQIKVITNLKGHHIGDAAPPGIGVSNLLVLPDRERKMLNWITRHREVSLSGIIKEFDLDHRVVSSLLSSFVSRGLVAEIAAAGEPHYRTLLSVKKGSSLSDEIWKSLDVSNQYDKDRGGEKGWIALFTSVKDFLVSDSGRFFLALIPLAATWAVTEWMFFSHSDSFTSLLSFFGLIIVSLVGGCFPALLVISSRRKGDLIPGKVFSVLGHPFVAGGIFIMSIGNLLLHGMVIWQNPLQRFCAIIASFIMLGITARMLQNGVFRERMIAELRKDPSADDQVVFSLVSAGKPVPAQITARNLKDEEITEVGRYGISLPSNTSSLQMDLPQMESGELKIWVYQIDSNGIAAGWPASIELICNEKSQHLVLPFTDGQILVPMGGEKCHLMIQLKDENRDEQRARF